jgi:hypothetical protein
VVARKIPENFDAHFSFLRARKIPRILVAAQSAGVHAHFSYTPDPRTLSHSQSMWNLNILPAEDHHNACQLFQGGVVNVSDFQYPIPQAILSQFRNAIDVKDVTIENVYHITFLSLRD